MPVAAAKRNAQAHTGSAARRAPCPPRRRARHVRARASAEAAPPGEAARGVLDAARQGVACALEAAAASSVRFACDDDGSVLIAAEATGALAASVPRDGGADVCVHASARGKEVSVVGRATGVAGEAELEAARATLAKRAGPASVAGGVSVLRLAVSSVSITRRGFTPEAVDAEAFAAAERDPLHDCAGSIIETLNAERPEDVAGLCRAAGTEVDVNDAVVVDVDRLGLDIAVRAPYGGEPAVVRVPFPRPVTSERDARSTLTMMAQVVWEDERQYVPPPVPMTLGAEAEAADLVES